MKTKMLRVHLWLISCLIVFTSRAQINNEWVISQETPSQSGLNKMVFDPMGNLIIAGYFSDSVDVDPSAAIHYLIAPASANPAYLSKFDTSGAIIWSLNYEYSSGSANLIDIDCDTSGNIYGIGTFMGTIDLDLGPDTFNLTSAFAGSIFIVKYDSNGSLLFAFDIGDNSNDNAGSIVVDKNNGHFYIAGTLAHSDDFDPGPSTYTVTLNQDPFIGKYDLDGNITWAFGINGGAYDKLMEICLDHNGNIYATGHFYVSTDFDPSAANYVLSTSTGTASDEDFFVAKYAPDMSILWAKTFNNPADTGPSDGYSIAVDNSGSAFITGTFNGTTDIDPGTGTHTITDLGGVSIFVLKLDSLGNYISGFKLGNSDMTSPKHILVNNHNQICLTGNFSNTLDLDPSIGSSSFTSATLLDCFIACYDNNLNYRWAFDLCTTTTYASLDDVLFDTNDDFYICGNYSNTCDFDPSTATNFLTTPSSGYNGFLAKYNNNSFIGISANVTETSLLFFPNPFNNTAIFDIGSPVKNIKILDLSGKDVTDLFSIDLSNHCLRAENLASGSYFLNITGENKFIYTQKIILIN
jgi:hypothetical protein